MMTVHSTRNGVPPTLTEVDAITGMEREATGTPEPLPAGEPIPVADPAPEPQPEPAPEPEEEHPPEAAEADEGGDDGKPKRSHHKRRA